MGAIHYLLIAVLAFLLRIVAKKENTLTEGRAEIRMIMLGIVMAIVLILLSVNNSALPELMFEFGLGIVVFGGVVAVGEFVSLESISILGIGEAIAKMGTVLCVASIVASLPMIL